MWKAMLVSQVSSAFQAASHSRMGHVWLRKWIRRVSDFAVLIWTKRFGKICK
jgi:uncharacterized membrane protein YkvI